MAMLDHFADLPEPCDARGLRHRVGDLRAIAICAVICGSNDREELALFGEANAKWFQSFLNWGQGLPSYATFRRVFVALDPRALGGRFASWIQARAKSSGGQLLAIDGKRLRRSLNRATGKAVIHMISAWPAENESVLGQLTTEAKSNRIIAIPMLLEVMDLPGGHRYHGHDGLRGGNCLPDRHRRDGLRAGPENQPATAAGGSEASSLCTDCPLRSGGTWEFH